MWLSINYTKGTLSWGGGSTIGINIKYQWLFNDKSLIPDLKQFAVGSKHLSKWKFYEDIKTIKYSNIPYRLNTEYEIGKISNIEHSLTMDK